jgi:hypothetical protein
MLIHADLSAPAFVDSNRLDWVPSPVGGIERRMLERDGGEVARATSLVRYAPGSAFNPHRHDAGEEFFVLEGVFSDETGDFPRGYYVRNAPGSQHRPASAPGAVIFVKLRQMPAAETVSIRLDTRDPALWQDMPHGRSRAMLFSAPWEDVDLWRLPPGDSAMVEMYPGGVELFVIEGAISESGQECPAGSWLRRPAGAVVDLSSQAGALIYRKTGHLPLAVG